jgi:hypothetical protein
MKARTLVSWLVVCLLIGSVSAQQATVDRFRSERPIAAGGAGPRRLAVDVPLLTGAQPSLADLRLFDEKGAAVPYILLQSQVRQRTWASGDVLPITATDKASGFEADFRSVQPMDGIRVAGLRPPFLKRLTLEGSGDRVHWTLLAAEGTLFDLPDEGLRQIELGFPAGTYRYLRVTWDDRNSGRVPLPAGVHARHLTGFMPPPPLSARLAVERRGSEPGRSRYRVKLPAPHLPITAIDVIVPPDVHVYRQAYVRESRMAGMNLQPADLGVARLMQVAQDGVVAGAMRIPIQAPSEAEIDLVIEDGNNPPLNVAGVSIVFDDLPWIYFEAPAGPLIARYGNPTATRPSYDLEAVRNAVHVESVKDAAWGETRRIAAPSDATPAAAPLPDTGARLDGDLFSVRRAIPDGPPGLVALSIDADVLAHSRGPDAQFADVRIIDGSNRQVPYIIERRDEPLTMPVSLERREPGAPAAGSTDGRVRSSYLLRLPYTDLPPAQLVVDTSARVFQRAVELFVERPADRNHRAPWHAVLAVATWSHMDNDEAASALVLPLPHVETNDVWLSIDEGDNSALPITGARLLLPSYRLRFYRHPGAALRLAYGRGDLAAPRYDLALLAPQVLGVEAQELAAAGATPGDAPQKEFISHRTFWVLLSSAVLVLVGLIVRLARKEDAALP